MQRILVTGGSGFIGTNVVEHLKQKGDCEFVNLDLNTPKCSDHLRYWKKVDICDREAFVSEVTSFNPHYVIHLAARTDLMGASVSDYSANTDGVENLLYALDQLKEVRRVIFTSSMLVCKVGYQPKDADDYAPSTSYGESKVETETLIKKHNPAYSWSLIRPTSIWGPWFGEPYANFFKMVLARTYVDLGTKACTKTYGYIDNAVFQIMSLMTADEEKVNKKTFYIGDYESYNISQWAHEIGKEVGVYVPTVPYALVKVAAWVGDVLRKMHIPFPMTSFRLKNMTTDNVIDMSATQSVVPHLPVSRHEGILRTIAWLKTGK